MKNNYLILFLAFIVVSCSSPDEENSIESNENSYESNDHPSIGSGPSTTLGADNTQDIVVTGGCQKVGCVSADIYLYVNTDKVMFEPNNDDPNVAGIQYCEDSLFIDTKRYLPVPYKKTEAGYIFFNDDVPSRALTRLGNLSPNTTYYYRAFAKIDNIYYYGSTYRLLTGEIAIPSCGPVNLGLSVRWAACNVSASYPTATGGIYAWGECVEKQKYNNATYLNLSLDAANILMGDPWRTPTPDEWQELMDKCSCSTTTFSDRTGLLVTGSTGYSIFLPCVAPRGDSEPSNNDNQSTGIHSISAEGYGSYWSSGNGIAFAFTSTYYNPMYILEGDKYYGRAIRAVCP